MPLTVGEKIKKYRLEKGMTQEELGKELGVGRAAVQKYESNQVQNLKSAHIKNYATYSTKFRGILSLTVTRNISNIV